jgi:hypothetical protein
VIRTQLEVAKLVDQLLDDHVYSEIADILNKRGLHSGASARPGRAQERFTTKRVAYLMHTYGLRSRYDRLRERGMLNRKEMAVRLGIHEYTLTGGPNTESSNHTCTTTMDGNSTSLLH